MERYEDRNQGSGTMAFSIPIKRLMAEVGSEEGIKSEQSNKGLSEEFKEAVPCIGVNEEQPILEC